MRERETADNMSNHFFLGWNAFLFHEDLSWLLQDKTADYKGLPREGEVQSRANWMAGILPAANWTTAVILMSSCCLWWWRTKATATHPAAQASSIKQPPPHRTRVTWIKEDKRKRRWRDGIHSRQGTRGQWKGRWLVCVWPHPTARTVVIRQATHLNESNSRGDTQSTLTSWQTL